MNKPASNVQLFSTRCPATPEVSCNRCRLNAICLPISMHVDDIDKVDKIVQHGRSLQRGDVLYRAKDKFRAVYAVRSGTIKTVSLTDDGEEQVTGVYLPGEITGLDGLTEGEAGDNQHARH